MWGISWVTHQYKILTTERWIVFSGLGMWKVNNVSQLYCTSSLIRATQSFEIACHDMTWPWYEWAVPHSSFAYTDSSVTYHYATSVDTPFQCAKFRYRCPSTQLKALSEVAPPSSIRPTFFNSNNLWPNGTGLIWVPKIVQDRESRGARCCYALLSINTMWKKEKWIG